MGRQPYKTHEIEEEFRPSLFIVLKGEVRRFKNGGAYIPISQKYAGQIALIKIMKGQQIGVCKKCGKEVTEYWNKTHRLCIDCVRKTETDEFGRSARYG